MPCGMREVFASLQLSSPLSGHLLLEREMPVASYKIALLYRQLEDAVNALRDNDICNRAEIAKSVLAGLRDIRNTLSSISAGKVPDDIELYEIKNLAMISERVRPILKEISQFLPGLPVLEPVVDLLDPESFRVPSFYIYDSYDSRLSEIRREIKASSAFSEELYSQCALIEDEVRRDLSVRLIPFVNDLNDAMHSLAEADILLAKANLFIKWHLVIPKISEKETSYTEMFNPEISELLGHKGMVYQPVSLMIRKGTPTLLVGANMGGKSVTLRTLALSQLMFQFGLGVPAQCAEVIPIHQIHFLSGDYQDIKKGLSSFAAEMRQIDKLLRDSEKSSSILALLDEPAKTTNPYEGRALVESLLSILKEKGILSITATHYNADPEGCVKLRVKGMENGVMNYQIVCADGGEAPREAINIAKSLGIDERWLNEAVRLMEKKYNNI